MHQKAILAGTGIKMALNFIDVFLILVILASALYGWHRGFILGLLDLVRWLGSFLAAFLLYAPVARLLEPLTDWSEIWTQPVGFLFVLISTSLLIQFLGNQFLRRLPLETHERRINKIMGVLPGFVCGSITAAILAALLFAV